MTPKGWGFVADRGALEHIWDIVWGIGWCLEAWRLEIKAFDVCKCTMEVVSVDLSVYNACMHI